MRGKVTGVGALSSPGLPLLLASGLLPDWLLSVVDVPLTAPVPDTMAVFSNCPEAAAGTAAPGLRRTLKSMVTWQPARTMSAALPATKSTLLVPL